MSMPRFMAGAAALLLASAGGCGLHPGNAWNRTDGQSVGAAVGSDGGTSSSTGDDATDQSEQGLCPATSPLLSGARAAGALCASPTDCASTCCDCGTGSQSWLAASCVAGRCVDSLTSCSRTNASYCGGGIIVAPVPTSQCGRGPATTACDTCIDTSCCAEALACSSNASCAALESCDASCGQNQDCRERCYATSSGGVLALQALDRCVASACSAVCGP